MDEQIQKIQLFPGSGVVYNIDDPVKARYNSEAFVNFLDAAMGMYKDTNQLQLEADQKQIDFVLGKSDDLIDVMIAQEKANTSLQFTVQVTSKVLEAYKELMRMQI